ncbi:VRR-NUC domain-containing protein [Hahella ganghwensis]|uniref:VRR-NUC domain-containing protein n=1 Tax=Hahella ganghwensis TaxID=286420 RepID=UPI00036892B4|nr:VRR-NUC domain-containing protein [Hahella ganghwensis]
MNESVSPELDPLYYLHNFQSLVGCVTEQYGDLLNEDETAFIERFLGLPEPEQALMVRMYSRRSTLFRADKLQYSELPPLDHILPPLEDQELITINPLLPPEEMLELVTCPEMNQWWPEYCPKKSSRPVLLEQLEDLSTEEFYNAFPHALVEILHQPLIDLFQLLFFGNLAQDLSTFVTVDLGHVSYEPYSLESGSRLFRHREDIDHAVHLMMLRDEFYCMEEFDPDIAEGIIAQLPVLDEHSPLIGRFSRLCNRLGKAYEQQQMPTEALHAYSLSKRPPARERQARILFKQGQFQAAADSCVKIIEAPWNEAESLFAERFEKQCRKQLGHKVIPNRRFTPPIEMLNIPQTELRVEQSVLLHLYQESAPCYYVENWLMNTMFGLTFWEAVFAPVRGAFTHPFQRAPHDLFDTEFPNKRASLIKSAFESINQPTWRDNVQHYWTEKYGISNPFVGWYEHGWDIISRALEHIPKQHWTVIFHRMLSDLRENCSGFPDLIQFYEDGSYKLLEVKSPTDKVQPNQLRWMKTFESHGIPCSLVQVQWVVHNSESLS